MTYFKTKYAEDSVKGKVVDEVYISMRSEGPSPGLDYIMVNFTDGSYININKHEYSYSDNEGILVEQFDGD